MSNTASPPSPGPGDKVIRIKPTPAMQEQLDKLQEFFKLPNNETVIQRAIAVLSLHMDTEKVGGSIEVQRLGHTSRIEIDKG